MHRRSNVRVGRAAIMIESRAEWNDSADRVFFYRYFQTNSIILARPTTTRLKELAGKLAGRSIMRISGTVCFQRFRTKKQKPLVQEHSEKLKEHSIPKKFVAVGEIKNFEHPLKKKLSRNEKLQFSDPFKIDDIYTVSQFAYLHNIIVSSCLCMTIVFDNGILLREYKLLFFFSSWHTKAHR